MAPISLKKGIVDELAKELVKHILNVGEKNQNFKIAMEYVMSNLRFHRFLDVNPLEISRSVQGLSSKFRVNSQDKKAVHLENLVDEFVNQPLLDIRDEEKKIQTDAHYALLSLLLNSSNNPLKSKFTPKDDEIVEKVKTDGFDWTSFLLSDEEKLTVGVDLNDDARAKIDNSDDEFWDLSDNELGNIEYISDEEDNVMTDEKRKTPIIDEEYIETPDVSWIYDNVIPSYWTDKEPLSFRLNSDEYGLSYSDICRNWEIYKNKNDVPSNLESYKLLTEKQLVIETLWMLQGIENLYIYEVFEDKYIPNKNVVVSHLTEETLKCYMRTFTDIGDKVVDLKKYSERILDGSEHVSKSFRAFAYVLARYLMERSVFLAGIEKTVINKDKTMTLLVLKNLIVEDTMMVKCIHQLYLDAVVTGHKLYSTETERVVYFMDIFYARLRTFDILGDAGYDKFIVLLPMFLDVCQPYLNDMDKWMTLGQLPHMGDEEFMIYKAKDIEKGEAEYWSQTYKIKETKGTTARRATTLVPDFVHRMQKQILLAGKSLGLLAEFGNYASNMSSTNQLHEEFKEKLKDRLSEINAGFIPEEKNFENDSVDGTTAFIDDPTIDPLLKENFQLMFRDVYLRVQECRQNNYSVEDRFNQTNEWVELLKNSSCHPPIKLLLEQCLCPVISNRYDKACAFLSDFFRTELKLFHHLQVMKDFFLTEAGGTMYTFFSELFDMAKRKVYWQDIAYLNIVLQDALQMHHPDMVGRLKVDLQQSDEQRSNAHLFDGISLHYIAPWPITIILDVKTEQKYNEILKFLIKVKRAIWVLEQLRFQELVDTISSKSTRCSPNSSDDEELPRKQRTNARNNIKLDNTKQKLKLRLIVLRMKMLHVLHSFHFYLMTRIKNATSVDFLPKVKEAKDLGEILDLHHSFLRNLKKRCFLHENIGRSKEAIFKILSSVLDFEELWGKSIFNVDGKKLDIIENDFHRCKAFLHYFFSTLGKRGSYPHFEFLAHSLKS